MQNVWRADQCAAPCMKGGDGSTRSPALPATARATIGSSDSNSSPLCACVCPPRAVTKISACRQSTPFGMPVVPPGVEDVEVVRRPLSRRSRVRGARQRGLVVDGTGQQRCRRPVVDLQQHVEKRQLGADPRERRREARVVHDRARARVAEEVDQLFVDVAVVDVERRGPRLVGPEHPFEVLDAVVEVERDVVLTGLVIGEPPSLGLAAETTRCRDSSQGAAYGVASRRM